MAGARSDRPVVAELGRPETPEEKAAREAERSRRYRQRKTVTNLVASLAVSLLALAAIVFIVPRGEAPDPVDVDFTAAAAQAQQEFATPLAVPEVPENWDSNAAELRRGADGVAQWYIGFVIAEDDGTQHYAGLSQAFDANDTWVADLLGRRPSTGETRLGDVAWVEYDHTDLPSDETGNAAYALTAVAGDSTLVVYGSGRRAPDAVRLLATASLASIEAR